MHSENYFVSMSAKEVFLYLNVADILVVIYIDVDKYRYW